MVDLSPSRDRTWTSEACSAKTNYQKEKEKEGQTSRKEK